MPAPMDATIRADAWPADLPTTRSVRKAGLASDQPTVAIASLRRIAPLIGYKAAGTSANSRNLVTVTKPSRW
jgi:hypothetical protein